MKCFCGKEEEKTILNFANDKIVSATYDGDITPDGIQTRHSKKIDNYIELVLIAKLAKEQLATDTLCLDCRRCMHPIFKIGVENGDTDEMIASTFLMKRIEFTARSTK